MKPYHILKEIEINWRNERNFINFIVGLNPIKYTNPDAIQIKIR